MIKNNIHLIILYLADANSFMINNTVRKEK